MGNLGGGVSSGSGGASILSSGNFASGSYYSGSSPSSGPPAWEIGLQVATLIPLVAGNFVGVSEEGPDELYVAWVASDSVEAAAGDGVTLFRAVSNAEAADIRATTSFRIAGNSAKGGKYFFPTQEQAQAMVDRGWADQVASASFPQSTVDAADALSLPTEGNGYYIPARFFPHGPAVILK